MAGGENRGGRRRPTADRDAFTPGLRPRGHEDVLHATTRELLASLPRPALVPAGEHQLDNDHRAAFARLRRDGAETTAGDQELVRAFLYRHGHRSER